ncbi:MAG: hypothetical protein MRY83_05410, partial [Flavobacteriales bacterium]|nr:hypothetical protein [Flavobacteriales bacterium]
MKRIIIITLTVLFFLACKKKKNEVGNTPPTIELINTSPLEVVQFDSVVTIQIKYIDPEGDV